LLVAVLAMMALLILQIFLEEVAVLEVWLLVLQQPLLVRI
jgi:hypothetical protein